MIDMDSATLFAAKSNKEGLWECVPQHLADTANVMRQLCDPFSGWVAPAFIDATGMDSPLFEKVCVFLAYTHDLGKLTPAFQNKIVYSLPGLEERLRSHGFDIRMNYGDDKFYHAFASGAILHEYFDINDSICDVVAAHHGIPRDAGREYKWSYPFKHHKEYILGKNGEFKPLWDSVIENAEKEAGIQRNELPKLSLAGQILLSGLLITADWIASNENYFPLTSPWNTDDLNDCLRGEKGYRACGIQRGWFSQTFAYDPYLFEERFGFRPNRMQDMAGKASGNEAQLLIIEGPMGSGKTEAALMCAEVMAATSASGGFFIGLPTQATSNGMFSRVMDWAASASGYLYASINLAHGASTFNDEFKALQVNTSEDNDETLSVNKWMSGRHRKLMADFVDGTIDQALAMSLNKKYFMLLHEQLAGKVIVFDEVHSYDEYTNAYLGTTLAYLGYYHCPVILLSATLTNERKQEFISSYLQGKKIDVLSTNAYPCITWWDGKELHYEEVIDDDLRTTCIDVQWLQYLDLIDAIRNKLSMGGCAAVIRNTVKEAIRTYFSLKQALPDFRVILIHSRFLMDDRSKREKEIIALVGKNSTEEERNKLIIVGTQVLEQSLDLDFDVMFTDPCPMDLLFQRLGREHRHKRPRPGKLSNATAYLLMDEDRIIGSNDRPYSEYVINRTCELVTGLGRGLLLPNDIKPMVEQTYDLSLTEDSPAKQKYLEKMELLKRLSEDRRMPSPRNGDALKGLGQKNSIADLQEEGASRGVRLGDDSKSVLLLKSKNGYIMDIGETVSCAIGNIPDDETERVFLRQVIRVPGYMITYDELARMKQITGFGDERIWAYKDILVLDENCSYVHVANSRATRYRYDRQAGLMEDENG